MEGIFIRKKFISPLGMMSLCGIFLIGLYIFLSNVDSQAANGSLFFLLLGIIYCLAAIPPLTLNYGAYLHVSEESIKAKYHWFGKIDCKLSDVEFVFPQTNTLTIYLKNGKYYTVMGISNAWQIASFIRQHIFFEAKESAETLIEKRNKLKSSRKKDLIYTCICSVFMFVNIFITVFLTGERELHEFNKTDWIIMAFFIVIEIATLVAAFYFANKTGKKNIPLEKLNYEIQRTVIETETLPSGNMRKVFTDENYTYRITVFGYPNDNSVYYTVEELSPDYSLIEVAESEIFENFEQISDYFKSLIDITEKVKKYAE